MSNADKHITQFKVFDKMLEGISVYRLIFNDKCKVIDGVLEYMNSVTVKTMNLNPENSMGKSAIKLFDSIFIKPFIESVNEFLVTGKIERFESYYPPTDKYFLVSGFEMPDNLFAVLRVDITKHKKAEEREKKLVVETRRLAEELKKARDNLQEQVEERTSEIEETYTALAENEARLKDIVNELERSNEKLERFAYITSHDLQEPLRTIASYAGLMEKRYRGKLDSDADEFLDYMISASKRMKDMIQGLMEYSRVGTQDAEFVKTDMNVKLEKAIFNLESAIDESGAEITHDFLPTVNADPNQMVRVFQNLIGNAIKFKKPEIPPKIHVSTRLDQSKKEWVFSVEDNGIGMEEEYTDKIFEVFKRLHAIDEYDGTGIGLAIVEKIVSCHGGRVWVKSELGKGSTFYFTIPITNLEKELQKRMDDYLK